MKRTKDIEITISLIIIISYALCKAVKTLINRIKHMQYHLKCYYPSFNDFITSLSRPYVQIVPRNRHFLQ